MIIVLDTNVLIAALISRGTCHEVVEYCVRFHELFTSNFILNETTEKLTDKFHFTPAESKKAVTLLHSGMKLVPTAKLPKPTCRDPDDDNIIATAIAAKADCLITGDKDLLVLNPFDGITILNPAEFWKFNEQH